MVLSKDRGTYNKLCKSILRNDRKKFEKNNKRKNKRLRKLTKKMKGKKKML